MWTKNIYIKTIWRLNQPIWTYDRQIGSNWIIPPGIWVKVQKHWNHHLDRRFWTKTIIIYIHVFFTSQVVAWDFFHQQYDSLDMRTKIQPAIDWPGWWFSFRRNLWNKIPSSTKTTSCLAGPHVFYFYKKQEKQTKPQTTSNNHLSKREFTASYTP